MDRGYVDFERLYGFTLSAAFFAVRTKSDVILQRRYSHPVDRTTGVRSDHTVILTAIGSAKVYPDVLRRVSCFDVETGRRGEDPDPDRRVGLHTGGHRSLPDSTDFERHAF
jgi:hypothetical protein